ncbi:MarR family winged helix-turn-helix transcriptional regulator [Paraburkholderia sediminicola]|uniref:MarR family winged helix-turn-helix transcriptional regulator n=1 Tax=Paraburkholderia sediminicola TaxID=458836 RepID=UPI0038BBD357
MSTASCSRTGFLASTYRFADTMNPETTIWLAAPPEDPGVTSRCRIDRNNLLRQIILFAMTNTMEESVPVAEVIPDDLLTFRVSVLSQLLARVVEASVSEKLGLSARQWRFLMTLNRIGKSTSGEIAQFSHLDYSQVSRAGAELVEKELVVYAVDAKDKRKSYVSLSAKGKRAVAKGLGRALERQARLKGALTADEYQLLGSILTKLTTEARQMLTNEKSEMK